MSADASWFLWVIIGALIGLVMLYLIIRAAVAHGIRDVRRRDAEDADRAAARAARANHLDADGL